MKGLLKHMNPPVCECTSNTLKCLWVCVRPLVWPLEDCRLSLCVHGEAERFLHGAVDHRLRHAALLAGRLLLWLGAAEPLGGGRQRALVRRGPPVTLCWEKDHPRVDTNWWSRGSSGREEDCITRDKKKKVIQQMKDINISGKTGNGVYYLIYVMYALKGWIEIHIRPVCCWPCDLKVVFGGWFTFGLHGGVDSQRVHCLHAGFHGYRRVASQRVFRTLNSKT